MKVAISAFAIAALAIGLVAAGDASAFACTRGDSVTGSCPEVSGSIGNGGVDLSGSEGGGGSVGSGSGDSAGTPAAGHGGGIGGTGGSTTAPPRPPRDGYTVTLPGESLPAEVTLADLVNFKPQAAVHRMEPDGWMVVGLDTNFYAETAAQVLDGQLLGRPASVRFTPRSFHWGYGDGAAATRATGGAPWAAQRVDEFDPTPTSHVFHARGTYTITLSVDVGAEYRFDGGGWKPIAGTLPVAANPLVAKAGDAKTVLVDKDCRAHPSGPGCRP